MAQLVEFTAFSWVGGELYASDRRPRRESPGREFFSGQAFGVDVFAYGGKTTFKTAGLTCRVKVWRETVKQKGFKSIYQAVHTKSFY